MPVEEPPRKRPTAFLRALAYALELPFILVAGVVIGGGIGWWLDQYVGTAPLLAIVLGLLGFIAGLREILRRIPQNDENKSEPGDG